MAPVFIYQFMFILSVMLLSAGIACYAVVALISKSNNLGDFFGSFWDHAYDIKDVDSRHDISMEEGKRFVMMFGENPFLNDDSKAPDALKANMEDDDIFGELEEVNIPLFKPLDGKE